MHAKHQLKRALSLSLAHTESVLSRVRVQFTERDVGILIDLQPPPSPGSEQQETEAVFWLVTSRARTKMAEAQHDAYMDYVARQKAAQGFDSASAEEGGNAVDETKFIDGSGEEVDLDKELLEARSKAVWAAVAEEEALMQAEKAAEAARQAVLNGGGKEGGGGGGGGQDEVSSPVLEQAPSHLSSGAGPDGWSPERSEGGSSKCPTEDSF